MKPIEFSKEKLQDYGQASSLEWLEANGIGGYASSTVAGAHTRRYHGLLVASMRPPVERNVVLSKLDETLVIGDKRVELSTNTYGEVIHPKGFEYLTHFKRDFFPQFTYEAEGVTMQKTIVAINGENTIIVIYEVLDTDHVFTLELLPLCAYRDFHGLSRANEAMAWDYRFENQIFRTRNYEACHDLFISVPGSDFRPSHQWYYNFEYSIEKYRGLDYTEDLFSHGTFSVEMGKGSRLGIIISTADPAGRDALTLYEKELTRRIKATSKFRFHDKTQMLALAADQFIVKRGENLKSIIAGYHWFSDWGRDSMISLPGLCLSTGRYADARKIIKAFSESISEGMLPNRFSDYGEKPEYNTIDATLWFFVAIYKYYKTTKDSGFVKGLLPVLDDILSWHINGTRYNIHVDTDGLLYGGEPGVQLTWMDAKVGNWVVTPRTGKAVEINALWFNAICIYRELSSEVKGLEESKYVTLAATIMKNFSHVFWNESTGYLNDSVDGGNINTELRPNQIYALSLPFKLLTRERSLKVLDVVREKLLVKKGLRSLSPDQKDFNGHYGGDSWHRDGAYHQGTVWSFLIGAYVDALVDLRGNPGKAEATQLMTEFLEHLEEGCVGSVSEIFDGNYPHCPRGCAAQAWGVAEALRVIEEYNLFQAGLEKPKRASIPQNTIGNTVSL